MSNGTEPQTKESEPSQIPGWVRNFPDPKIDLSYGATSFFREMPGQLWRHLLANGRSIHSAVVKGFPLSSVGDLAERMCDCGGSLVHEGWLSGPTGRTPELLCIGYPDAVLSALWSGTEIGIAVSATSRATLSRLVEHAEDFLDKTPGGWVRVLIARGRSGLAAEHAGRPLAEPLLRDNYREEVLHAFDHVVADMNRPDPCGRLVLLDGPPGTGKTYLVRALAATVSKANFLLVPAALAKELGRPELLAALIDLRDPRQQPDPLVLIIEDADSCLVPRQADNVDAISTLLNATDGLLGAALNLWIVATTNVASKHVDPALVRPGRLCRRLALTSLTADHAERIFARMTGRLQSFEGSTVLGAVYAAART